MTPRFAEAEAEMKEDENATFSFDEERIRLNLKGHEIEVSDWDESYELSKINTPLNEKVDEIPIQTPTIKKVIDTLTVQPLLDTRSTDASQRSHKSTRFSHCTKSFNDLRFKEDNMPRRTTRIVSGYQMENIDENTGSVTIFRKRKTLRTSRASEYSKSTH